jgi:uncharacterized membrane protein (UPF0127 family)
VAAALVLATTACGGDDSSPPGSSALGVGPSSSAPGVLPVGYRDTAVELTLADGTVLAWCVWLADDPAERARGLMEVTDLGGHEGMLFRYAAPATDAFYMRQTRIPLSIAFFDEGRFVSAADMAPCPDDDDDPACPRYGAGAPYTDALEVPLGDLAGAGIGPGTVLAVRGACP